MAKGTHPLRLSVGVQVRIRKSVSFTLEVWTITKPHGCRVRAANEGLPMCNELRVDVSAKDMERARPRNKYFYSV